MNRRSFITGLAAVAVSPVLSLPATAAVNVIAWRKLGTKRVSWFIDNDTFYVGRSRGAFRKILLKVRGNGLQLLSLRVVFANGGTQNVPVRRFIPPGGQTRQIDLNGGARFIQQVQLVYRRPVFLGLTSVELWGRN